MASAYHQKMKFITPNGVGEVRGDQPQFKECYAMALKGKNAVESLPIELLDLRDELRGTQLAEDLISIPLCPEDNDKVALIGSSLSSSIQRHLTEFLQDNADVFAWAPIDMPGIDPEVSIHRLGVDTTCKPVKQKRRHFAFERRQAIKEEVERLLKADFIREIQYPDCYLVPKIDQLIDATAGHELLSVMDAFSGYNQIRMYESDIPKTSFVTDQGTYCYRVMPFGLKNAEATYQRLVLKKHSMKLNPTKCTFGVGSGKFLGFMVSQRGTEANPEKINAVVELTPPKTIREVQRLTGMIAALERFISKSAERCLPVDPDPR
ncbi:uncharacterized protein LOC143878862 [Tasmannia lanceolata]|uniref:uncharacterized protein LOC143878862 n=1 Tax=Tasmannia lanceolata TaxID=3420 RepID=UPI00406380C4